MSNSHIKASDLVEDIRKGLDDDQLMKKYGLSSAALASALTKLVETQRVTQAELDSRCTVGKLAQSKSINSVAAPEVLEQTTKTRSCLSGNYINRSGAHSAGGGDITDQALTEERNFFLGAFLTLVVIGVVFRLVVDFTPPDSLENLQRFAIGATFCAKMFFVYLVFRLSRFLRQPVWLTVMYCVLTPFSILYLIPFIGLLVGVKNTRRALSTSARGRSAHPGTQKGLPSIPSSDRFPLRKPLLVVGALSFLALILFIIVGGNLRKDQSKAPKVDSKELSSPDKNLAPKPDSDQLRYQWVEEIARRYHVTHTYSMPDLFVCTDMAMEIWNQLDTNGIKAYLRVGSIDTDLELLSHDPKKYYASIDHAWVMFRISSGYLPIETTEGYVVTRTHPKFERYFKGPIFESPKRLKHFMQARTKYFEICKEAISMNSSFFEKYRKLTPEVLRNMPQAIFTERLAEISRERGKLDQKKTDCQKAIEEFEFTVK